MGWLLLMLVCPACMKGTSARRLLPFARQEAPSHDAPRGVQGGVPLAYEHNVRGCRRRRRLVDESFQCPTAVVEWHGMVTGVQVLQALPPLARSARCLPWQLPARSQALGSPLSATHAAQSPSCSAFDHFRRLSSLGPVECNAYEPPSGPRRTWRWAHRIRTRR